MIRQSSIVEIRDYYRAQGYLVRINENGYIEYKRPSMDMWRDGRWISEYFTDDRGNVHMR